MYLLTNSAQHHQNSQAGWQPHDERLQGESDTQLTNGKLFQVVDGINRCTDDGILLDIQQSPSCHQPTSVTSAQ